MADEQSPVTEQDLVELNQRLADLDRAEKLIDQSVRAGIDMTEQQKQTRELRSRLMKMKQAFFPGR